MPVNSLFATIRYSVFGFFRHPLYAFTEFLESIDKDRVPDTKTVPVGLRKMKDLGVKNAIIEMDLVYRGIDYKKFKVEAINDLLLERLR